MTIRFVAVLTSGYLGVTAVAHAQVTFHKDVEPILQAHCQSCHRPGEIGPMPLLSYDDVRPWARAIKTAVTTRKMPPWFADSSVQHYTNDASLSAAEIDKLASWVDAGAPRGDPNDSPRPRTFVEGWNIGQPDVVIEMPQAYEVPARGTIEYTYVILPTNFTKDTWVQAAEIRPGNRAVMHHAALHVRPPGSPWLREFPAGVAFVPAANSSVIESRPSDEWLTNYAPGRPTASLPAGTAFLVKAGSDFVLQFHYTPNGRPTSDLSKIGLVFAQSAPEHRAFIAPIADRSFVIPPGDSNYRSTGSKTLATDAVLLAVGPHMHLRGKAMEVSVTYPTGMSELLLRVPKYDFNWQLLYEFGPARVAPRGTRLDVTGVWDNSAANRSNPDPKSPVRWGDQSWEEMLIGWVTIQVDPTVDVDAIFEKAPARVPSDGLAK
jgi:hypothetical protein